MSKHGSPTDTIRAIMRGQINEAHGQPHIDPPYDVEAAVKALHDNGVPSAKKVGDNTVSVSAADSFLAARVLDHSLNKGVIPAPVILVSDESLPTPTLHTPNPVVHEELKPEETHVTSDELIVRDLVNKKENQLKKIDEVSRGTLQSYIKKSGADDAKLNAAYSAGSSMSSKIAKKGDQRERGRNLAASKISGDAENGDRFSAKAKVRASEAVSYVVGKIEQINELSKNTLRNYIVKASAQAGKHNYASGVHAGANYHEKDAGERSRNSTNQKAHGQKADKRFKGIAKAANKLAEETIEEKFDAKADHAAGYTHHIVDRQTGATVGRAKSLSSALKSVDKRDNAYGAVRYTHKRLGEEVELTEGKKDDLEKASKKFATHPLADKMYQSMQHAAKTCNYVTDACDHVYNNHREHVKYADWHAMKPHIENHFRERGLEG